MALNDLGSHVVRRSDHGGHVGQVGGVLEEGDAEVGESGGLGRAGLDQDIRRFHIPMDDAVGVHRAQADGDLAAEFGRLARGKCAATSQQALQIGAVDEVHHDGQGLPLDNHVVDPHHMGRVDSQGDRAFSDETPDQIGVAGQSGEQKFDCEGPAGAVCGPPDLPHRACTEDRGEEVVAAEGPTSALRLTLVVIHGRDSTSRVAGSPGVSANHCDAGGERRTGRLNGHDEGMAGGWNEQSSGRLGSPISPAVGISQPALEGSLKNSQCV